MTRLMTRNKTNITLDQIYSFTDIRNVTFFTLGTLTFETGPSPDK